MTIGIVGRKSGMTRIFTDSGVSIPVTVIEIDPNRITQVKNVETDGYNAVQLGLVEDKPIRLKNVTKPLRGHFEKTGGGEGLRLRAIVVRKGSENDLVKRASLLRRDSVHGPFDGFPAETPVPHIAAASALS